MTLNLRGILLCFQAISGLNINLNKSESVNLGGCSDIDMLANLFACRTTSLPIKYLGVPLGFKFKVPNFEVTTTTS